MLIAASKRLVTKFKGRITYRLAFWVFVFSSVITLCASCVQMYFYYRGQVRQIQAYFDSISQLQIDKRLSHAVWIMDERDIDAHLHSLLRGLDVTYVVITDHGKVLWQVGEKPTSAHILTRSYPLYSSLHQHEIPLGTLEVVADLHGVYKCLYQEVLYILGVNLTKNLILSGCILLFFQFAVTRHLEKLASHVISMNFKRKELPLKLDRKPTAVDDEFSQVVNMINDFQRRAHRAFKAMARSETRLRLFFDASDEGIFCIDATGKISFVNNCCLQAIQMDKYDVMGRSVHDVFSFTPLDTVSGEEREQEPDFTFSLSMETGKKHVCEEGVFRVASGPTFYVSISSSPVFYDDVSAGAVFLFMDISAKREMIREKNLLNHAVRNSPLLIAMLDAKGRILSVNPSFERQTGYASGDVVGRGPFFMEKGRRPETSFSIIYRKLRAGEKWQELYMLTTRDGRERYIDLSVMPIMNKHGVLANIVALGLDITQEMQLHEKLNQVHKMEAVSRLAASFAHEFGNPLLGVRSVIKDIAERVELEEDRQILQIALTECDRMKNLIRDFRQFQRLGTFEKEICSIEEVLNNVLLFHKCSFEKRHVRLEKNFADNLPPICICKNQVKQVFLNLVINGIDAMAGENGVLTVSTLQEDEFIVVEIQDNGCGIEDEVRDLIFEPFYSTKPEVQGTGLGLSISYNIIAAHGGDITVSSEVGKGTVFTVYLPCCQKLDEELCLYGECRNRN